MPSPSESIFRTSFQEFSMRCFAILACIPIAAMLFAACSSNDDTPSGPTTTTLEHAGRCVLVAAKGKAFSMGSSTGLNDEKPKHTVTLSYDFWMDTTEVTQAEYERVMKAAYAGYTTPNWHAPYGVGGTLAAYQVEWGDAALYCNARSKAEGLDTVYQYKAITGVPGNGCTLDTVTVRYAVNGYRLPTEAEWEYACRAGSTADYFWGKNFSPYPSSSADSAELGQYSIWAWNSWDLSSDSPSFGVHAVASRKPNAFGLYDMMGNVWEWCNDWYDAVYYETSPSADPIGPEAGAFRALRGGSWGNDALHLRASTREFTTPDYLFNFIGFRPVRPKR
jgi:formylglycine-generating enzyme required for sulfatase activity